jgi:type IX secretion system PorP/SprF family membrane protein
MRKLVTIGLLILATLWGNAQQLPTYSGFFQNKYLLNPAVAGSEKFMDIKLMYRTQWAAIDESPTTQILSIHSSIDKKKFGVGGYIFNDAAGVLSNTGINLTYSYHIPLNDLASLSFGLSGSYASYRVDGSKVTLLNPTDQLVDLNTRAVSKAFNASAGMFIYHEKYYFGLSGLNLLSPDLQFFELATTPPVRHLYGMFGWRFFSGEDWVFEPSTVISLIDGNPNQYNFNFNVNYAQLIQFGAGYRFNDAFVFNAGIFPIQDLGIVYAYDLGVSTLKKGHSGSHEILLSYKFYYKAAYKKSRRQFKWIGRGKVIRDTGEGGPSN